MTQLTKSHFSIFDFFWRWPSRIWFVSKIKWCSIECGICGGMYCGKCCKCGKCCLCDIYIYIYIYIYIWRASPPAAGPLDTMLRWIWDSILTFWSGLGPHVGGPWRCQGPGLGPGLARGRQNGLNCIPARSGARFYWDPEIQGTKVESAMIFLGPTNSQKLEA